MPPEATLSEPTSQLAAADERLAALERESRSLRRQLERLRREGDSDGARQVAARLRSTQHRTTHERATPARAAKTEPSPTHPPARSHGKTPSLATTPSHAKKQLVRKRRARSLRRRPLHVSLLAHGVMLLAAALASFASFSEEPLTLWAGVAEAESLAEMPPLVEFAALEDTPETPAESPAEFEPLVDLVAFEAPAIEAPPAPSLAFQPMTLGAAAMLAVAAGEPSSPPAAAGAQPTSPGGAPSGSVSFFGAESAADRVVYVIDNSGSMQRGRLETSLMELRRSIRQLSESQSFYVVVYSDQAYPMFFPDSTMEMLPATRPNQKKLIAWLGEVEMCMGGRLLDAMELAASLDPHAVFVLSDGDIRSDYVMRSMTEESDWEFTVHTVGMTVRNADHAGRLQAIAQAHGGQYRNVEVHPGALKLSLRRPVPYHREPGPVWGSQVRAWGK
ncbi:hypothetical protein Mal64_38590 [Pseudobythopirellula maris]|uniref:VWFA domain-containing protein n=1 Tax=Pseudobythopirellula maris TaxID=2527991 RepID=A0A5C5ZFX7_9BACT|nr:VWA domain-containing protein [Pseudobythopirellula maris]TWT86319.1 hypothetical protein Mal64_38590 [Pseudobythopirellula maris]